MKSIFTYFFSSNHGTIAFPASSHAGSPPTLCTEVMIPHTSPTNQNISTTKWMQCEATAIHYCWVKSDNSNAAIMRGVMLRSGGGKGSSIVKEMW